MYGSIIYTAKCYIIFVWLNYLYSCYFFQGIVKILWFLAIWEEWKTGSCNHNWNLRKLNNFHLHHCSSWISIQNILATKDVFHAVIVLKSCNHHLSCPSYMFICIQWETEKNNCVKSLVFFFMIRREDVKLL